MGNPAEFDATKFAAELVQKNLSDLVSIASQSVSKTKKRIETSLRSSYTEYILKAAEHYGTARTFFIRDERKPLYNYYVPLEISCGETSLPNASISKLESAGLRAVLTGKAGCGKSTLMRHLFLDSIRVGKRVPIFVELNLLNDDTKPNLLGLITKSAQRRQLNLDDRQIQDAIASGRFAIFLDGLDEVEERIKKKVIKQIIDFSDTASNCLVVISSRPDDSYSGFLGFNLFEVQPLSLRKAVELVDRLPFDEEIKTKFIKDLRKELYRKHTSFLSNPLLLSIMLLTYGQSASIPSKVCVFYNQAYEALFQTHDAYKGGYSRKRRSNLDIKDFERVFSAFCLVSYDATAYQFSRTECAEFFEKARAISQIKFDVDKVTHDCLQSVNLLMSDGLGYAFVHRSFQEYFSARFIVKIAGDSQKKLIERAAMRDRSDNVIDLCWELDQRIVEDHWVVPSLKKLKDAMGVKRKVGVLVYPAKNWCW